MGVFADREFHNAVKIFDRLRSRSRDTRISWRTIPEHAVLVVTPTHGSPIDKHGARLVATGGDTHGLADPLNRHRFTGIPTLPVAELAFRSSPPAKHAPGP